MLTPYQMQLQQMLGPGGMAPPMLGPSGTQQMLGPGGTQQQPSASQQMNLPNGSPYSENTGYPTPPPTPANIQPMLGPGGTQQHLLGPGGMQWQNGQPSQQNSMNSMNMSNPYLQFMQMLSRSFFPAQQSGQGQQFLPGVPNPNGSNMLPQTLLSVMQNPSFMSQLQAMFGG